MTLKLLFVDDDVRWRNAVSEALADWSRQQPESPFVLTLVDNAEEARIQIATGQYDCALLDLRMPEGGQPGLRAEVGAQLALNTLSTEMMPVAIFSGNIGDVGADLERLPLVRAFSKAGDIEEIIRWFDSQRSMMISLRVARETLRKAGAAIFLERVWPRWRQYGDLLAQGAPIDRIITRQFATHIAELMGTDDGTNPSWHPMENYIRPALLDHRPHTGDIFRIEDRLWVVLTPQCDMANKNVEDVLLARCDEDALPRWASNVEKLRANPDHEETRKWFSDRVNQNIKISQHFLPPLDNDPILVNFNALRMVPLGDLERRLDSDRIACVSPSFLSNLTQRFGAFMARPGQPNIDVSHFAAVPLKG